jgi:hypothetical protein
MEVCMGQSWNIIWRPWQKNGTSSISGGSSWFTLWYSKNYRTSPLKSIGKLIKHEPS